MSHWACSHLIRGLIDLLTDTAAVFNSVVSDSSSNSHGMLRVQTHTNLLPLSLEHPIPAIWNNRIQMATVSPKGSISSHK